MSLRSEDFESSASAVSPPRHSNEFKDLREQAPPPIAFVPKLVTVSLDNLCPSFRAASRSVVLADDVIALKHVSCSVPTDLHRDPLGDMAADHVANRCSAEVVRDLARQFRRAASIRPGSPKISDWCAAAMKNEMAIRRKSQVFRPLARH